MHYTYCSLCGSALRERDDGNLACTRCTFVNYRNPRPTATVLVLHNNKLLLAKRSVEPFKGWWDPLGGFVERGEHPQETAVRELKQETGLDINITKLFGIYTGTFPSDTDPFYIITMVYLAECNSDKVEAHDDVMECRWFSKEEVPTKIAFDSNTRVVRDFLKVWK